MSGLRLTISLEDTGIRAVLDALAHADTKELLDEVGGYLDSQVLKRFAEERGPDGQPWKPSARAQLDGDKTLQDSGRLRDSVTHHVPDANHLEHGSNVLYAAIHQEGGTIRPTQADYLRFSTPGGGFATVKEVTIPARRFIGIGPEEETEIPAIAVDWWQGVIDVAR